MAQQFVSNSVVETQAIAAQLAVTLQPGDILAYEGGMGMGKTAFTRGVVQGLGGDDVVCSPTFALVNEYTTQRFSVYHFDMYRVDTWDDLYATGFFDYLESGGILLIEWSENIDGALPDTALRVQFALGVHENQRIITIEGR